MSKQSIQIIQVQDDNRIFIDMADDPENPCGSCGACCNHFRVSFYCGEMSSLGGQVPDALASKVNPVMACMQGTESGGGRCVALKGEIGRSGISCGIYANRPSPCREYPVWMPDGTPNPDCQRLRARAGIRPLVALS